jgi:hypothetical protein
MKESARMFAGYRPEAVPPEEVRGADDHSRAMDVTRPRIPVPILVALAVLLPIGPVGLLLTGAERAPRSAPGLLADLARRAGCTITSFSDGSAPSNPPVTGRMVERALANDGSHAGRRPPSPAASMHALLHGRVLFQYRRDVDGAELRALDRLARRDAESVLLFENQSRMPARVAATAYLSLMTCPGVNPSTIEALAAFRDRRRAFGQGF